MPSEVPTSESDRKMAPSSNGWPGSLISCTKSPGWTPGQLLGSQQKTWTKIGHDLKKVMLTINKKWEYVNDVEWLMLMLFNGNINDV